MKKINARKLTMTALLSAMAAVLMFFNLSVPLMPSFIKLDFSELPALIASFALGPISGVTVCLIKNLVNLFSSSTGGIGELSNFILGACFVVPAGLIYKRMNNRKGAFLGAVCGAVCMAVVSAFSNYYIVYPIYMQFLSLEKIMAMYQAINPRVDTLWQALWWFNVPFTFVKGMLSMVLSFLIYKHISPFLKGK